MQFFIEFLVWIGVFLILKKYWHFIDFVLALNGFACIMYFYIMYLGILQVPDGISRIFLHGIVAIIIYTLTKSNFYEKEI